MSSSIDWKSLSAETQRRGITSHDLKPLGIYWSRGPPIKKPEKPGFSRFRKRMVPPLIRSSQAPSASATPAPELVTNEQAQSVEDLTAEASERQSRNLRLGSWRLSENYIRTSCLHKRNYRPESHHTIQDDKGLWPVDHGNAISDAKAKRIGEISETSFWVDDFAMAVQEIISTLRVIGKSTNNPVKIYEILTQTCKVCGMYHHFTKCFYAFPKKAPSADHARPRHITSEGESHWTSGEWQKCLRLKILVL